MDLNRVSSDRYQRGLRILSIDGGGVRGYSPLLILKKIEEHINMEIRRQGREEEGNDLKPYQLFDLMVGSSTGGLIAIMLGRLRMSINEAIEAYRHLSKRIFSKKKKIRILGRYYSREREDAIKQVIEQKLGTGEAKLLDSFADGGCRVAVTSVSVSTPCGMGEPSLHRSYLLPDNDTDSGITILLAAMATTAAPLLFKPVRIEDEEHIDGAFECNNPTKQARLEAQRIWHGCHIDCILSLGTGRKSPQPLQQTVPSLFQTVRDKIVDPISVHREEYKYYQSEYTRKVYFRFDVSNGLSDIRTHHYKRLDQIQVCTKSYLGEPYVESRIGECVELLVPLKELEYPSISTPRPALVTPVYSRGVGSVTTETPGTLMSSEQDPPAPAWRYKESRDYHPSLRLFAHTHRLLMDQLNKVIDAHLDAKGRMEDNRRSGKKLVDLEIEGLLEKIKQDYIDILHALGNDDERMGSTRRYIKYQRAQIDRFLRSPEEAYQDLKSLLKEIDSQDEFDPEAPTFVDILNSLSIICQYDLGKPNEAEDYRQRERRTMDYFIATRPWHSVSGYLAQLKD